MNPGKLDMTQDQEAIRKALTRFVQSPAMAGSERLRDFMTYIVEESLAGRGADIRGKTIAQDLYPKSGTSHENRDNLVRVDAGRLRRKLADYYAGPGANDPLRLHLDKGGYMPWCEEISPSPPPKAAPIWHHITARAAWAAAALAGIGALAVTFLIPATPIPAPPPEAAPQSSAHRQARMAEREALLAKSPATLHAANLCEIGRGLLFPIAEPGNQITAQETFRQAISRDPSYACGYAGLAHSLSTTSLLQPPGAAKDAMMQEAVHSAQAAVERDPTSGWSQSALAWAHFTSGALEAAMRHSALAEQLSPNDGNVLDFRALILLLAGEFNAAHDISAATRPRLLGSDRFANQNIHAVANFHLGRYDEAIAALEKAMKNGQPVSALTLVYLTAAHAAAERLGPARLYASQLMETAPDFHAEVALPRLYHGPGAAEAVLSQLRRAGWQAPS